MCSVLLSGKYDKSKMSSLLLYYLECALMCCFSGLLPSLSWSACNISAMEYIRKISTIEAAWVANDGRCKLVKRFTTKVLFVL